MVKTACERRRAMGLFVGIVAIAIIAAVVVAAVTSVLSAVVGAEEDFD